MFVYSDNLVSGKYVNLNAKEISTTNAIEKVLLHNYISHKYFGDNSVVLFRNSQPTSNLIKTKTDIVQMKISPTVSNLRLISSSTPKYPLSAHSKEIEGEVVVKLLVATDGTVKIAKIEKSSNSEILDRSTLEFVYNLVYEPLKINDIPRDSWTYITYTYIFTR